MKYLHNTENNDEISRAKDINDLDETTIFRYYFKMTKDNFFMNKLLSDQIITINDDIFATWFSLRDQFTKMLSKVTSMRYGFITS